MAIADETRSNDPGKKLPTQQQLEDVPRETWKEFLDAFSLKHDGWIANIEIVSREGDSRIEAKEKRFSGISVDKGGEDRLFIGLDDEDPGNHLDHQVTQPRRIALYGGNADDLMIQSADGLITVVRFVRPGKPSEVAA